MQIVVVRYTNDKCIKMNNKKRVLQCRFVYICIYIQMEGFFLRMVDIQYVYITYIIEEEVKEEEEEQYVV